MEKHYRRTEVEAITGLRRSTIYDLMKRGQFPCPVRLSERAVGWPESRLSAWLKSRPDVTADELGGDAAEPAAA
jgi:prophage regulatory protein